MKYIYITLPAIDYLASKRVFQSCDFSQGVMLSKTLKGENVEWSDSILGRNINENGIILYTSKIDRDNGLLIDLDTFNTFISYDTVRVCTIFQKIIKGASRYFHNQPYGTSEKIISGNKLMIFPFPFEPKHDAYKVMLDRNTYDKRGKNLLIAYAGGEQIRETPISFTNLNKALAVIKIMDFIVPKVNGEMPDLGLAINDLDSLELKIDSTIGYDNWMQYLTDVQREFVIQQSTGPEKLEGGAGTGKTISLVLKCIHILKEAIARDEEYHIIFFTHSSATKGRLDDIFYGNWNKFQECKEILDEKRPKQSILITTLQEWCSTRLGFNHIDESEFLDKDANTSKEWQRLYVQECIEKCHTLFWPSVKNLCSSQFIDFIENTDSDRLVDIIQKEISEVIKGQASNELENYLTLERTERSLHLANDSEKKYLFKIFSLYQESLESQSKYDTDDITISALGQLNTPIWNRRRDNDGFDLCVIDETQLFNLNEISVFHFVNKKSSKNRIVFALDKSQAIEDVNNAHLKLTLSGNEKVERLTTLFRSSPEIANVAYSVLTSGATLFKDFENPFQNTSFTFTAKEEQKCWNPEYFLFPNDISMIEGAFDWADKYRKEQGLQKSDILFVTSDNQTYEYVKSYVCHNNKQAEFIERRSDLTPIQRAKTTSKYVISPIDFVGGLEFDAVAFIGFDKRRVPPSINKFADHVMNFVWHNKLYVAITRAKYTIVFFGDSTSGYSPILDDAIYRDLIKITNSHL